jgi:hypothetical protein
MLAKLECYNLNATNFIWAVYTSKTKFYLNCVNILNDIHFYVIYSRIVNNKLFCNVINCVCTNIWNVRKLSSFSNHLLRRANIAHIWKKYNSQNIPIFSINATHVRTFQRATINRARDGYNRMYPIWVNNIYYAIFFLLEICQPGFQR